METSGMKVSPRFVRSTRRGQFVVSAALAALLVLAVAHREGLAGGGSRWWWTHTGPHESCPEIGQGWGYYPTMWRRSPYDWLPPQNLYHYPIDPESVPAPPATGEDSSPSDNPPPTSAPAARNWDDHQPVSHVFRGPEAASSVQFRGQRIDEHLRPVGTAPPAEASWGTLPE
jgi:hypothetical protein